MTARVLDRRSSGAHRLRIERARMTAELWQLVRLGPTSAPASQDVPAQRQSARRAKSLLGVVIDSATGLRRSAATQKSKRGSKSKRTSAASGSIDQPTRQPTADSLPAPSESMAVAAARLESADGRVVRGATDRTEFAAVMEIATGLASILRG